MSSFTTPVQASVVLTAAGVFTDTQTVIVGGKTYTTQTVLTNVDGNVLIGASAAATLQNLLDACNLTGTPGTQYALAMTLNAQVYGAAVTATTLTYKAKCGGTIGNLIASTETQTNASFAAATLLGGTGDAGAAVLAFIAEEQLNAAAAQTLREVFGFSATS